MINEQRVKAAYKAAKRHWNYARWHDGSPTYGSPEYHVARKFKITCAQVREIVGKHQGLYCTSCGSKDATVRERPCSFRIEIRDDHDYRHTVCDRCENSHREDI